MYIVAVVVNTNTPVQLIKGLFSVMIFASNEMLDPPHSFISASGLFAAGNHRIIRVVQWLSQGRSRAPGLERPSKKIAALTRQFLPARRRKRGLCYGNVSVCPSVTAGIVSIND